MAPTQLTHEEIERMRQLVLQHDQSAHHGIQEFDLNKPPKQPYRYQEFPRCLYQHESGKTQLVHNEAQLQAALARGWSKDPVRQVVEEPELDPQYQAEAAKIDHELRKPKKEKVTA